MKSNLLSRISIDPEICFGKPCIRGHRIWVSLILDMLADGMSTEEVLSEYPQLDPSDLEGKLRIVSKMRIREYSPLR